MKFKKNIHWLIIFFVVIILIIVPIKFPDYISTYAKLLPLETFVIERGTNGQVLVTQKNNLDGNIRSFKTLQVDRDDLAIFEFTPFIKFGSKVEANDTVAVFRSSKTELLLAELEGKLNSQMRLLKMKQAGEKTSLITEQKNLVELEKTKADEQSKIFARQKALFEKGLISEEAFDQQKSQLEILQLSAAAAEEKLKSLLSGVKKEEIEYLTEEIESLRKQIEILQKREKDYTLISPFCGVVNLYVSPDTLLQIVNSNEFAAQIPVDWEYFHRIYIGQNVDISLSNSSEVIHCTIDKIDPQIHILSGKQVFSVWSKLSEFDNLPPLGLITDCEIIFEDKTIFKQIESFISGVTNYL